MPQHNYSYEETNKVLTHMAGVSLKICLTLSRKAYSGMCPIEGSTRFKQPHCGGGGRKHR